MKSLQQDFTDKENSPCWGIVLLRKMLKKIDSDKVLTIAPFLTQGSNRCFDPKQLIVNFPVSGWCEAKLFEHMESTQQKKVIKDQFDWKRIPGSRADTENRIKEMKYDFRAGRFISRNFRAKEATLIFVMLTNNPVIFL